ncbi:MAG: hypothetical protein GEU28_01510 [Dehalococcoidia bacterium]|nr:hypothetical protein [Dehalococcoidia bacterium]
MHCELGTGLQLKPTFGPEPNVPLVTSEALYRTAQEALHNVVKHAHASKVNLKLLCDASRLTVEIIDDGRGFDPDADYPGHLGCLVAVRRCLLPSSRWGRVAAVAVAVA